MGCGIKTARTLMIIANVLFLLAGIGLIALGSYVRVEDNDYNSVFGKGGPFAPSNIMIAAGVFVFVISFLGCCGAMKKNKCLLILFICLIVVVLLCETALIVLAFVYRSEAKRYATDAVKDAIKDTYDQSGQTAITKAVDNIQKNFKCCGASNYTDWLTSKWITSHPGLRVPKSCCSTVNYDKCQNASLPVSDIFTKDCATELETWAKDNLGLVGGFAAGVVVIELLALVFAAVIIRHACSIDTA